MGFEMPVLASGMHPRCLVSATYTQTVRRNIIIVDMGVLIFDIYLSNLFPWYVERPQKPDKALIHLQMMFLITRCLRYHM